MTKAGDNDRKPSRKGGRSDAWPPRLRQNLRRRKAQERQRGAAPCRAAARAEKLLKEPNPDFRLIQAARVVTLQTYCYLQAAGGRAISRHAH